MESHQGTVKTNTQSSRLGQRSRKLENAFHVTVKYALRGIPPDEFETYFPEYSLPRETLEAVYNAYIQCLHQARIFIDREFEEICEEANIADKLQTLDVMCAQQGFDGSTNAEFVAAVCASQGPRVARAAALKAKKEAIGRLQAIKDDIQQKNLALVEQLENKKAEARRVRSSLSPIGGRLEEIQRLAEAWSSR